MSRRLFMSAALALASASALLGACKASDTAGNTSAATVVSRKPGSTAPAATTEVHADGVRRLSVAELQKMVEAGDVAIYDTRSKPQYDEEHIRGALSMPHNEVEARAGELPRDKTLVFYCT